VIVITSSEWKQCLNASFRQLVRLDLFARGINPSG
jgi:hypothetical protein